MYRMDKKSLKAKAIADANAATWPECNYIALDQQSSRAQQAYQAENVKAPADAKAAAGDSYYSCLPLIPASQPQPDHASYFRNVKDNLNSASKLKADIQSQVYQLIAALKTRELELCKDVDRHILKQYETDDPKDTYFTTRLEFRSDFNNYKHLLENYGHLKEFNCSNKLACADNNQLQKGQTDTVADVFLVDRIVRVKDVADSFEFVDSVECLSAEKARGKCCQTNLENFYEKEELECQCSKEALEKLSCCSTDSFDVIHFDSCEMTSNSAQHELPPTPAANQAGCNKRYSECPTFYLPNLQKREPKDSELQYLSVRHSPKRNSTSKKQDADVLPITSEATATGIASDKSENKSIGQKDANVLPMTSEADVAASKNESGCQEGADTPANALQASFRVYLQEENLGAWVHPKRESGGSDYEQWVVKSPGISKGSNAAFIDAFTKQLKSFAV